MNDIIEHSNIIYMPNISELGGIETYVYEMVKKYQHLDIAVVSKQCDMKQAQRIRQYCKLYIHTNQQIKCDVAIINYDTSIIPFISENARIYETIHGDYSQTQIYKFKPPTHPRITGYIAITKFLQGKIKDILQVDNVLMSYNPLTIDDKEKPLILVSATRLHKNKGKDRMKCLASKLDQAGIDYIWYVFTNDNEEIQSPNVIFLKNRLDVNRWVAQADYVVLLSDSEALSYTLNEGLYRNIPVICTPLPYLDEIGVKNGLNAYIMAFDCSNVDDIVKNIKKIPKFTFNKMQDKYADIFTKNKSRYEEEKSMKAKVKCIMLEGYYDTVLGRDIAYGEEFEVDKIRAEYLEQNKAVKILKVIDNKERKGKK